MSDTAASAENAASSNVPSAVDVESWRRRIKADTFARYHLGMGEALEREGSADAALSAYRRAVETMPDLVEAHFRLVALLGARGRRDEAEQAHQAALRVDPLYDSSALREIGRRDLLDDRPDSALPALARAVAGDPQDVVKVAYHAAALICCGRIAEGRAAFAALGPCSDPKAAEVAVECFPLAERRFLINDWSEATPDIVVALTELLVRLDPANPAIIDRYCLARHVFQQPEAILSFVDLNDTARQWPMRSFVYKGWAHLYLAQWTEAESLFQNVLGRGLAHDPFVDFAAAGLGVALFGGGRAAAGRAFLSEDVARHPGAFWVLRLRGMIELAAGRPDDALPFLKAAQAANQTFTTLLADIGLCELMRGNVDRAKSLLNEARASAGTTFKLLMPDDPWVLLGLALTLEIEGKSADADRLYRVGLRPHLRFLPYFTTLLPEKACTILGRIQARQ